MSLCLADYADLAGKVRDVAHGVQVCLEIIERDMIDGQFTDDDGAPLPALVDECAAGSLSRLSIAAVGSLGSEGARRTEIIDGMAERQQRAAQ